MKFFPGHSIGGLVAKSLFLDPKFDSSSVNIIITLATPHSAPVVSADQSLSQFYNQIDTHWNKSRHTLDHLTLISIGGGINDIQVRPGLTYSDHGEINIQTTYGSGIWVSADHLCIVWCKQLTLTLNRALFDLIEVNTTKQITDDQEKILNIFKYHLVQRTGGKRYKSNMHPEKIVFEKEDSEWKDILKRQFTFKQKDRLTKNTYLMVKTLDDPKHEYLTIDAVNMDHDNWVYGCKSTNVFKSQIMCENGINLSQKGYIIPSNGKRKTITVNLKELRSEYSHVFVFMAKGMDHLRVTLDVYNSQDRFLETKLPKWINFWMDSRLVKSTIKDALFYNFSLLEMDQTWQAYDIIATPLQCSYDKE